MEQHVKQSDASCFRAFCFWNKNNGAVVAATTRHQHVAIGCNTVLGSYQSGVAIYTRCEFKRNSASINHVYCRRICFDIAFNAIASKPNDRSNSWVKIGNDFQCLVRQAFTRHSSLQYFLHQRTIKQALITARNSNGDCLCLMLNGIDWTREFIN